jgi:hypothetical protein
MLFKVVIANEVTAIGNGGFIGDLLMCQTMIGYWLFEL